MSESHRESRELQPHRPPEGISDSDYEAIEDAVMETARGRWFLKEYARRMRAAETQSLRSALERIENMIALHHAPPPGAARQARARERLQDVSERLLDISWYMRERGFSASVCTSIDEEARQLVLLAEDMGSAGEADGPAAQGAAVAPEAPGPDVAAEDMARPDAAAAAPTPQAGGMGTPAQQTFVPEETVAPEAAMREAAMQEATMQEAVAPEAPAARPLSAAPGFARISAMSVRERLAMCA